MRKILSIIINFTRYSSFTYIFDLIYLFQDPWKLNTDIEKKRFQKINNFLLIKNNYKKYKTILEVGCGEGYQSQYLSLITKKLISIDISKIAITKANKRKLKNVIFQRKKIEEISKNQNFDLIVLCEMIYYIKDIPNYLAKVETFTSKYLISYYSKENRILKKIFNNKKFQITTFNKNKFEWFLVYFEKK